MLHPVMLWAVALLVINDHVLKHSFPGLLTGKLSDVAGLCFFPVFLVSAWEIVACRYGRALPHGRILLATTVATAIVFTAVKTLPWAAETYRVSMGALQWPLRAVLALLEGVAVPDVGRVVVTPDVSDLLALPAVAVGLLLRRRLGE